MVEVREGKTTVKGNRVCLASLAHLRDVSELLLKQFTKSKSRLSKVR